MRKLMTLVLISSAMFAKAQSCDTFTISGRSYPVYGVVENYPTPNDTLCWYLNANQVNYALPTIGVAAFSSTTVCPVSNSHSQPGAIIAVQDFTSGKVLYVPNTSITNTGFNVNYAAAAISDSFYYWIWNHK